MKIKEEQVILQSGQFSGPMNCWVSMAVWLKVTAQL